MASQQVCLDLQEWTCFRLLTTAHVPNLFHLSAASVDEGLVDDNNFYEWEVMIIGYVVSIPPERDQVDLNNPYTS